MFPAEMLYQIHNCNSFSFFIAIYQPGEEQRTFWSDVMQSEDNRICGDTF